MRSAQAIGSLRGVFSKISASDGINAASLMAFRISYSVTPKKSATILRALYLWRFSPKVSPLLSPSNFWRESPKVVEDGVAFRCPWRLFSSSNARYALPRSMMVRSCRRRRLVATAMEIALASSASTTSAGIVECPVSRHASVRLCPARISYCSLFGIGRTIMRS